MSLNTSTGLLKIDGDTKGAVAALDEMKKKGNEIGGAANGWGDSVASMAGKFAGIAVGIGAVAFAFAKVKGLYDDWMKAQSDSADLFSQFGNQAAWVVAEQAIAIQNASDGVLKIQTAAKSYNLLVRGEIAATTKEVQGLAKASFRIAQEIGGDANQIMEDLTRAVLTGQLRTVKAYGIVIDEANVAVDAHIAALTRWGEKASENDIELEKKRNIMRQIVGEYENEIIKAADLNEIEGKYQNERARNAAISAKMTETQALKIQSLKHGWQDAKDGMTSYFTGLEYNSTKVMGMVSEKAKRDLQNFELDTMFARMEEMGKSGNEYATVQAQYEAVIVKLKDEQRLQMEDQNFLNQKDLEYIGAREKENTNDIRLNNERIKQHRFLAEMYTQMYGPENDTAKFHAEILTQAENYGRVLESNNEKYANAKLFQLAAADAGKIADVIKDTNKFLNETVMTEKELAKVSSDNLAKRADDYQANLDNVQKTIKAIETREKLGQKLTVAERGRLKGLKDQEKVLQSQVDLMVDLFEKLTGINMKLVNPPKADKGSAPAWYQEYQNTINLLTKGDTETRKAIEAKFGSLDKNVILKYYQDQNNALLNLEKKYNSEYDATLKERNDAKFAQDEVQKQSDADALAARKKAYQSELDASLEMIKNVSTIKVDYDAKMKELDSDRKKTREETLAEEKSDLQKKIDAIKTAQGALAGVRRDMAASDVVDLAEYKKVQDEGERLRQAEYEARKAMKDKTIELEKEKNKELREEMRKVGEDVKNYGKALITNGAGALYDAVTIEKDALKESAMSRSEMLRRALKDELSSIAKQAAVQAVYQTAMGLASYAVGDAKGGTAHFAAAAAYAGVAGIAYAGSRAISAPSDAEIARRKEKMKGSESLSNSRAGVGGTSAGGAPKVYNFYFPSGMILGDKDSIVREFHRAEDEANRRGAA